MFNRITKQIVIDMNQVNLFSTILINTIDAERKYHFLMEVTRLGALSGEEVAVIKFRGIHKDNYKILLTKLNKYGVKVYA